MCVVGFCIFGTSLTFEDLIINQGISGGEAAASLAGALKANWFSDVVSRFCGGVLAYFFIEKLKSTWIFIVIFTAIAFIGHIAGIVVYATDAGKTSAMIAPAVIVGLGSGAVWSLVPMELVEHAKYKAFGQNWGTVLLFGMIGFFIFSLVNYFTTQNGIVAAVIFTIFALIALISAILGWLDSKAVPVLGKQPTNRPTSNTAK